MSFRCFISLATRFQVPPTTFLLLLSFKSEPYTVSSLEFPLAWYYRQTLLEVWWCTVLKPQTRNTGHTCATCFRAKWIHCQSPCQFAWNHVCLVLRNWRYLKLSLLHFSVAYHESKHVFLQIVVSRYMKLAGWSRFDHWAGPRKVSTDILGFKLSPCSIRCMFSNHSQI
jgi:hypothetical protein